MSSERIFEVSTFMNPSAVTPKALQFCQFPSPRLRGDNSGPKSIQFDLRNYEKIRQVQLPDEYIRQAPSIGKLIFAKGKNSS